MLLRQHLTGAGTSAARRGRLGAVQSAVRMEAQAIAATFSSLQPHAVAAAKAFERLVVRAAIAIEANQRHPSLRSADPHPLLPLFRRRYADDAPDVGRRIRRVATEDQRHE